MPRIESERLDAPGFCAHHIGLSGDAPFPRSGYSPNDLMGPRAKWVLLTLIFGLLPYGAACFVGYVRYPDASPFRNSPELLFFSLMVSASALGELMDENQFRSLRGGGGGMRSFALVVFFAGAAVSALLYGIYLYHDMASPGLEAGLDCATVATWPSGEEALWGTDWSKRCVRWMRVRTAIFRVSVGMAVLLGFGATITAWLSPLSRR